MQAELFFYTKILFCTSKKNQELVQINSIQTWINSRPAIKINAFKMWNLNGMLYSSNMPYSSILYQHLFDTNQNKTNTIMVYITITLILHLYVLNIFQTSSKPPSWQDTTWTQP
jgi:hypothetical protein